MKISYDRPPLWDEIDAKFKVAGQPIIFAWGDTIFNPERVNITKELHAHEEIHGERQAEFVPEESPETSVLAWWDQYIASSSFRLQEEIPAHVAEYRAYCKRHRGGHAQRQALNAIANKLASPLYGSLISLRTATEIIASGGQQAVKDSGSRPRISLSGGVVHQVDSDHTAPPYSEH